VRANGSEPDNETAHSTISAKREKFGLVVVKTDPPHDIPKSDPNRRVENEKTF
jgi:hypothetical protein